MVDVNALVPVATLLLGAAAGYFADERRESRLAAREAAADERLQRREEAVHERTGERERDAFQRETLIHLQDALAKYIRATGAIHFRDTVTFRSTGRWARDPTEKQWNDASTEAVANTQRFRARVEDEAIRDRAGEVVDLGVAAVLGAGDTGDDRQAFADAEQAVRLMTTRFAQLQAAIGDELRARS